MNILFDFLHPVDINFFKFTIERLQNEGHQIFLIYRDRGPIEKILKKEFSTFRIQKIGNHKKGFAKKIIAQFARDIQLVKYLKKNRIEIGLSFGPSIGLACKINNIPFLSYADDPEYKLTLYYALIFATKLVMPRLDNLPSSVIIYRGYKELAYLHPLHYMPNLKDLQIYGLVPGKYVFIREVSKISLNYRDKTLINDEIIAMLKKKGFQIVMSLEDKSVISRFENDCIILKEPLNDIHAIIKNALLTISSGDTMARESCLLGTPTIYTGGRDMRANREFIQLKAMHKVETLEGILNTIDFILGAHDKIQIEKLIENKIRNEWDDLTKLILSQIEQFK